MRRDIEIEYSAKRIGWISFVENPRHLYATKRASGFEMRVPIIVSFSTVRKEEPLPMISNLHGDVFVRDSSGASISVGRLRYDLWETGGVYYSEESSPTSVSEIDLLWTGTFTDLALFEKIRDGKTPTLTMSLSGEFCFLLPTSQGRLRVRTEPQRVYTRSGYIEVRYPKETWVEMMRRLGVAKSVLVEVPLPGSPSPEWDDVWSALIDARTAFEQGGSTGWKGCVTSVRLALEKWQQHEPEDKGPGWTPPSRTEREARTKKQRLDNIRWHLLQLAHMGAHTGAEEWTRDDALLMLATLSTLLVERKP
jgi:hypothetical protein